MSAILFPFSFFLSRNLIKSLKLTLSYNNNVKKSQKENGRNHKLFSHPIRTCNSSSDNISILDKLLCDFDRKKINFTIWNKIYTRIRLRNPTSWCWLISTVINLLWIWKWICALSIGPHNHDELNHIKDAIFSEDVGVGVVSRAC